MIEMAVCINLFEAILPCISLKRNSEMQPYYNIYVYLKISLGHKVR